MGTCVQSMEGKLHNVKMIQAKVSTLEESIGELRAQQDMLSSAVEHIDLAQTELADNVGNDGVEPRDPHQGYLQHSVCRRQGHDKDDAGDDVVSTMHKHEFLKYNGTSDPLLWLNMCE
jgi:hypothetical protein